MSHSCNCTPIFYIVNNYAPIHTSPSASVNSPLSLPEETRRVSLGANARTPSNIPTAYVAEPQPFSTFPQGGGTYHVQNGNSVTSSLLSALENMNTRLQGSVLRDVFERSRTNNPLDSLTGIEFILGDVSDWEHDQGVGPRLTYDEVTALPHTCYQQGGGGETDCSICQTSFEHGHRLIVLPCNHSFHQGCVAPWLMQSNTCPLCRLEVTANDQVPSPPLSP